jgi:hypothetical protein
VPPLSVGIPAGTPSVPRDQVRAGGSLGSLIDADLALETTQLMDLQNLQSRRALQSQVSPAPQTLLSLFGDA